MTRMKELSTLRAIGMSTKKLKNMIIKENIMYAVFASIVASVFASHSLYEFNKLDNLARRQVFGAKEDIKFVLPIFESFEFLIVSIIICLIAVFFFFFKIEKMSIVEGLNTNE